MCVKGEYMCVKGEYMCAQEFKYIDHSPALRKFQCPQPNLQPSSCGHRQTYLCFQQSVFLNVTHRVNRLILFEMI